MHKVLVVDAHRLHLHDLQNLVAVVVDGLNCDADGLRAWGTVANG
jgi:hypothetical protein